MKPLVANASLEKSRNSLKTRVAVDGFFSCFVVTGHLVMLTRFQHSEGLGGPLRRHSGSAR
jgi:hypothetical protein